MKPKPCFSIGHFGVLLSGLLLCGCARDVASAVPQPSNPTRLAQNTTPKPRDPGELEIRPPASLDAASRRNLARLVNQNAEAKALWQEVKAEADEVVDIQPRPLENIYYEGKLNTDPQRIAAVENLNDMDKLSLLTHAYAATEGSPEQARYAEAMKRIVLAWSSTYKPTGNPINENKLEPVWTAYLMLRESGEFSAEERQNVERWLRQIGEGQIESARRSPDQKLNNWHTKRLKMLAQIGTILNEPRFLDYARRSVESYVAEALFPDGTSRDLKERDALSYHVNGLTPLLVLARELKGQDLYRYQAPSGASLQKSVEFVLPYARGEKVYEQWRNSKADIDHKRAAAGIAEYQPGTLWKPAQSLEMFELASVFDPELFAVVRLLANAPGEEKRFPTWNTVVAAASNAKPID